MRALKARTGFLITDRETQTYRNVAKPLGISILSDRQLQGLETKATFPKKLFGSFDPFLASKVADFKQDVRRKFRSQLNYLIYRYWVEPYYSQIKRLISIAKTLRPYDGSTPFQWMIGETMIRFVVSLCHLCNELYLVPEEELKAEVSTQLFGGVIQRREREELRATIANLISQLSQPGQKRLHPEDELSLDPEYIPALTEVAWRVTNQSRITRQLPRFADLMWYEFVLKDKPVSEAGMADFFSEREFSILSKILRDIIEFLTRTAGMDARLFETMFA